MRGQIILIYQIQKLSIIFIIFYLSNGIATAKSMNFIQIIRINQFWFSDQRNQILLIKSGNNKQIFYMGQFKALVVKNWILYKRQIAGSVLQIVLPIIFIAFVMMVRSLAEIQTINEQSFINNSKFDYSLSSITLALNKEPFKNCTDQIIPIAPEGSAYAIQLQTILSGIGLDARIYQSNDKIDEIVQDLQYGTSKYPYFCFGVSFVEGGPNHKYKLRFNITTNRNRTEGPYTDRDITTELAFDSSSYVNTVTSKMAAMTNLINSIIASVETGESYSSFSGSIAPIYQEEFINDPLYQFVGNSMEFLVLLPLLVLYLRQTSSMLQQKEKKIRQSMSIMGMKLWLYYLTWFLRYFIVYLVIHLIGSAILVAAMPNVPYGMILLVFILFDIVLIFQSFFIQIFFTRAKLGVVVALLFFILQYVINYVVATTQYPTVQLFRAVSIVPHVAYIQAFKEMLYAESNKIPLDFTMVLNYYTIATAIVSFILNIIFWGLLAVYLDQVVPNQWGAKKHPCFCFMCKKKEEEEETQREVEIGEEQMRKSSSKVHPLEVKNFEVQSVDGKYKQMEQSNEVIKIKNLVKNFDDFQAVKDLNLKIYKDQIFVLLGHNGAGKTTTISMLTGMLEPSHGSIEVLGSTQISQIRQNIGICPQHNTLYDDMTVAEHLELFGTFRGLEGEQLDEEVDKLIKDVNLEEKKNEYSKNLSGGQKRRLSVAMAFSGGSKVIVLDEPTAGMDTSARRYIWEMLKNYKNDRIIMLTTHFMDEADYLGDRIAIMAKGKLVTCGSNVYLKNKYGVGYNIVFVKKNVDVKSDEIIKCVRKYVISAKILSDISLQLSMQLPLETIKGFSALFNEIDGNKGKLGIQTYGISITTLEEVFLKVGEEGEEDDNKGQMELQQIKLQKRPESANKIPFKDEEWDRQDGTCERFASHLLATILKRVRVIKRDLKGFLFELILPLIIIILALFLMTVTFITNAPDQQLNYDIYYKNESSPNKIVVPIGSDDSTFLSSIETKMDEVYGNKFDIKTQTNANIKDFDTNFLFPLKEDDEKLKGGIYFTAPDNNTYAYKAIVNTRSPTSLLTVQTLAVETYMNHLSGNTSTISIINAPFPRTFDQLEINNTISGFFGALIFSIALSFKFASIVSFIVKERMDRSKHQQIVSGMNLGSYWIGNFLYDYLLYAVVAGLSIAICVGLDVQSLTEGDALGATAILFFLYGLTNIPLTYIVGYLFKDYGNAQAALYFFNFVAGGILPLIILILRWIGDPEDAVNSSDVARGLAWIFRIIPAYSFGEGMINLGSINILSSELEVGEQYKPFDLEITLAVIIYLAVFFFVYFAAVFLIQYIQSNENLMRCCSSEGKVEDTQPITDSDVFAEQNKALKADPKDYEILTKNLRKVYMIDSAIGHKVAVDNLSFGVQKGEVFGLLGVNGAGKTTTFKILAGEIVSTSGDSYFNGYKISENLTRIRKNLGYCPQFDALIDNLTVREQLELYYDMKCLPARFKQQAITQKIDEMDLVEYEDKMSGTLSGGNKRKLSVAMAMIGNPSIIFLDEPSTGMDPKARRFMWKIISRISTERKQSTIILTTHSMEEAEALSTRLGIMVSGNFKCIGTPQHIKSRYGKGFEIEVKLKIFKRDEVQNMKKSFNLQNIANVSVSDFDQLCKTIKMKEEVKKEIRIDGHGSYLWKDIAAGKLITVSSVIQFNETEERITKILQSLKGTLGDTEVIEQLQTYVRFKTGQFAKVGEMFDFLQSKKDSLFIQQYSIKQVTVEQIFNRFAEEDENYQME